MENNCIGVVPHVLYCMVGLVVEGEGGKSSLLSNIATYISSCLGIVRVVPLPWVEVGN